MRKMAAFTVALLPLAVAAAPPPRTDTAQAEGARAAPHGEIRVGEATTADHMNIFRQGPGCVPIERQVAGENRRYRGTRLDQEPAGRLILAVDRRIGQCHEVVMASDRRFGGR